MRIAINAIIALASTVPIINQWLEQLLQAYSEFKIKKLKELNKEAVDEAIKTHDQRKLESVQYSGKPSGVGTVVSSLPRMRKSSENKR
jgi:hypothetical protein